MLRRKKFIIGALIILAAVGYLAFTGFRESATYYYTVSEFAAQQAAADGKNVKVNGQVAPGSVQQDGRKVSFAIAEGGSSLPVLYQGTLPDTFAAGNEVVVEGHLAGGIFQAATILTKCPSKYVPQG